MPDPVQVAGDQLGFNQSPLTKYRQEVDSVFGEITIPFVTSTMNIPFVRSFEVSVAYRYEKFDDFDLFHQNPLADHISFDNGGTPRVSLRYQPIADLTLRASWGQSFRSPQPNTLFDPGSQNFPVEFDPLKGVTLQPPSGVDQHGNIGLLPEETDAYSAGVVWTPKFVPGFTMTADMYQLFTTNVIISAADFAQIMLTANGLSGLANGGVPTLFVDNIVRDAAGNLQEVLNANTNNAGKRLVEGLDVTATYEIPTERFGKFTLLGWLEPLLYLEGARGSGARSRATRTSLAITTTELSRSLQVRFLLTRVPPRNGSGITSTSSRPGITLGISRMMPPLFSATLLLAAQSLILASLSTIGCLTMKPSICS